MRIRTPVGASHRGSPEELNVGAIAAAVRERGDGLMICPVCSKAVKILRGTRPNAPSHHKTRGKWCRGGKARKGGARVPMRFVTADVSTNQSTWSTSKELRMVPKGRIGRFIAQAEKIRQKRAQEAAEWMAKVKARKPSNGGTP
jgi:hypothetical protein